MDHIKTGENYWVILSEEDCLELSLIGFEYFSFLFSFEDWNNISYLPIDLSIVNLCPQAFQILNISLDDNSSITQKREILDTIRSAF